MTKGKIFNFLGAACLLCALTTTVAFADEGDLLWKNRFGGSGNDVYSGTATLSDGGVVAVGNSVAASFDNGDWAGILGKGADDAIAVKYDEYGEIVWKKNYGGSALDTFNGVAALPDGGFVAVGNAAAASFGNNDFFVCTPRGGGDAIIGRFDNDGNILWLKNFGGSAADVFTGTTVVSDGIIAVGNSLTASFGNGDFVGMTSKGGTADAVIVKFDFDGTIIWVKNHGGGGLDRFSEAAPVSNGIVVIGESNAATFGSGDWVGFPGNGNYEGTVVKYDNDGNVVWRKVFGSSGLDVFYGVIAVPDGIVIAGYVANMDGDFAVLTGKGGTDAVILKLDNTGEVMWMNNFGGAGVDQFRCLIADDNGFFAAGYSVEASFGNGDWQDETARGGNDMIIVRFDTEGNLKWNKHFGGNGNEMAVGITIVEDGVVIVGNSAATSFGNGDWDGITGRGGNDAVIIKFEFIEDMAIEEAELAWKNRFGGSGFDMYSGAVTLSDGTAVAVGRSGSQSFNNGDWAGMPGYGGNDAIAVKYDETSTIVWKKNFGGTGSEQFEGITAFPGGGFVAVGYVAAASIGANDFVGCTPRGGQDAFIGRFDNDGNIVWITNFGGSALDSFADATVVSDGIIAVGYSASASFGNGDFVGLTAKGNTNNAVIVKFDFDGTIMWVKNHGGGNDRFESVTSVSDGIVAVGFSQVFGQHDWTGFTGKGGNDGTIVKFNDAGNVIWRSALGSSGQDYFRDVIAVPDGILIASNVAGMNNDFAQLTGKGGLSDAVILKFDNAGEVMWMKNFGGAGADGFYSVIADDNGFFAAGSSGAPSFGNGDWQDETARGNDDFALARFDTNGNLQWNKHFGGSANDYSRAVVRVSDGVMVAGYSVGDSFGNGDWEGVTGRGDTDAVMIKYDITTTVFTPRTISGTVTDGTNPIEDVKIEIEGTNRVEFTDQNGVYKFKTLQSDTYELTATKYGYYDKTDQVVVQNSNVQHNIVLTALPTFPVSGKVTGNEIPEGLEDVEVKIFNNYEDFSAITDVDGNYIFPAIKGIDNGMVYNITANLSGFYIYNSTVTVFDSHDPVIGIVHNITLNERLMVPGPAVAVEIDNNNVEITWEVPGENVFRHDSGVNNGQSGFQTGGTRNSVIGSVHRVNAELNSLQWYSTNNVAQPTYDLWIFGLNTAGLPDRTNVIYMVQNVPNTPLQWNTYQFPEPILVPDGFLIGVSPSNGGFTSIGIDAPSEEYPFMANENFYTSNYTTVDFANFAVSGVYQNCMIRAEGFINGKSVKMGYQSEFENIAQYIENINIVGVEVAEDMSQQLTLIPNQNPIVVEYPIYSGYSGLSRGLTNYRVYRLLEINKNDETLWYEVTPNTTQLTITDTNWGNADWGVYQWAIKAEYSGAALSPPRFTNVLPKDMEVPFTVNLTTNSQDPVTGAVITLNNLDDPTKSQTEIAEGDATLFSNIWRGNYEIIVMLDGFDLYSENVQILATGEHTANLIESLIDPFGLIVEVEDCNALFMWNRTIFKTYILDDGTAENGLKTNPNANLWAGNQFITDDEGLITSVDVYGMGSSGGTRTVTLDIFNETKVLIGSSEPFILPNSAWITVPLDNIPYSGTFYAMVQWPATPGDTYYLGYDENGPNATANLNWLKNANNDWVLVHEATTFGAGVFMIRPTAEIIDVSKNRAFEGYTVYLNGEEVISGLQTDEYIFAGLKTGSYIAGVQSVYTSGASDIIPIPFEIVGCPAYTVTYADPENGTLSVTAGGVTIPSGAEVLTGTAITITAIPDEGYNIGTITVNGAPHTSGEIYTVTEPITIVATFDIQMFAVTYTVGGDGEGTLIVTKTETGEVISNNELVEWNTEITVTATAQFGNYVSVFTINGVNILPETETEHNVISATVINCIFTEEGKWNLSLVTDPVNTGTPTGAGDYYEGEQVPVNVEVTNQHYEFEVWLDGTVEVSQTASFTYTMPAATTTLTAKMRGIIMNISATIEPVGSGTVTGASSEQIVYRYGDEAVLVAIPNDADGYIFAHWKEDETIIEGAGATYSFTVETPRSLTAVFELKQYKVTYETPANGTLSVTAQGIGTVTSGMDVEHGTVLTITATPDSNYELDLLKVNGEDIESGDTYMVSSETVIECEFGFVSVKQNLLSSVVLYPNPFTDEIFIAGNRELGAGDGKLGIKIFNVMGQKVIDLKFDGKPINTSNLSNGVYFVTIENNNGEKLVYKMVK